jgi:hypothetical protein
MLEDHVLVLSTLGEIMYSYGCPIDVDVILWAEQQIHLLTTKYPNVTYLMKYLKNTSCIRWPCGVLEITTFHMQAKTPMHQLNLTTQTLSGFCFVQKKVNFEQRLTKRKMDRFIYHLVGDVLTHYWYNV